MADLNNLQLQSLYNDFKPAYSSLFSIWVEDVNLNALAALQATGIKLPSETLNLERDKTTFRYKVKKEGTYQRTNMVSITWRENEEFAIKRFHEAWLRKIYDPVLDAYRAGVTPGLKFLIYPYRSDGTVVNEAVIELSNVIPQKWGDLDFSWSDEPKGINYTISYYVEEIHKSSDPSIKISGVDLNLANQNYATNPAAERLSGDWDTFSTQDPVQEDIKDAVKKEIFDKFVGSGNITPQSLLVGEAFKFTQFPGYELTTNKPAVNSSSKFTSQFMGFEGSAVPVTSDLNIPGAPSKPTASGKADITEIDKILTSKGNVTVKY